MNANQWKKIDELFDAALDLPKAERDAFLLVKTNGDDELRNKLLKLLEAADTKSFMEKTAMAVVARNLAAEPLADIRRNFIGCKLGSYLVEKQIGVGGMGEIYLANDEKLNRYVALKILPAEYISDDERVKRFELEARAISALNHPNIVTIHDVGNDSGSNFIATEYVESKTIRELIQEKPNLREILDIALQICDALVAANTAGIIHRDIKPENIIIRPDRYIKILDFGLAKLSGKAEGKLTADFERTGKGIIIGTPAYMSPEQVTGGNVDPRTDLWSVGVILYELLTGFNPYKKESRQTTFQSILLDEPPLASVNNTEVIGELDRILYKTLEKDPEARYQTAADLRTDLKRLYRNLILPSESEQYSSFLPLTKVFKTKRVLLVSISAFLLFAFIPIWYFGFGETQSERIDWSQASKLQLTNRAGSETFPTLAPDGKSFVFTAKTERGDEDLFLQQVGDKNAVSITKDCEYDDTQPAFSPDGKYIAYRSEREGASGIYVISPTGDDARQVADFGFHPAWSPDGKELVVSTYGKAMPTTRNGRASELWIITLETGAKRLLTDMDAMQPSWSPDGKFIAYWFFPPNIGRRDIGIIPVAGGEPIVIGGESTTNWNPIWSPNGKFLYYASNRGGNMSFWRIAFENGKIIDSPESVVTPAKFSRHLGFSGDGNRLIFVSTDNRTNLQAVEFNPKTEKTVGEPFWITTGDLSLSRPELSPDGTQFVFQISRHTQDDIVIMGRDGTNQIDLTNDAAFDRYPRWSPDGKRIAFASDRSGVYEIWIINTDGTDLKQITFSGKEGTSFPIWSPDGKQILYRCQPHTCIVDADKNWEENPPRVLPDFDPTDKRRFLAWNWSPDGSLLTGSFNGEPMDTGIYSFTENRFEIIAKMDSFPMWMPDSRRFIYGFENRLFIADAETKKTRGISSISTNEKIISVGISSDGQLIYYTILSDESDIWLLDNVDGAEGGK